MTAVSATPSACVLVLNYNGIDHLEECLGSALAAVERLGRRCAVVLVDNQSTDDSVAFTRRRFPEVEIVVPPRNDFLFSLNGVAEARREEVLIIVNNDMRFDEGFIAPLLSHFHDPDLFCAGAAIRTWDGSADTVGPRSARVERWWFHKDWLLDRQQLSWTLDACAGAAAYRRRMFVALGGFDPMFRPGYYEDLDLSYRAWTRGWKTLYDPRSRAYHKESASMIARYGDSGKARLLYRNHLLFTLKNVGGPAFLAGFLLLLPYRVLSPLVRWHRVPLAGFLRALPLMPLALRHRFRGKNGLDLSRFETVHPVDRPVTRIA